MFAARRAAPSLQARREPAVLVARDDLDRLAVPAQDRRRVVGRGVVDDDHLERRPRAARRGSRRGTGAVSPARPWTGITIEQRGVARVPSAAVQLAVSRSRTLLVAHDRPDSGCRGAREALVVLEPPERRCSAAAGTGRPRVAHLLELRDRLARCLRGGGRPSRPRPTSGKCQRAPRSSSSSRRSSPLLTTSTSPRAAACSATSSRIRSVSRVVLRLVARARRAPMAGPTSPRSAACSPRAARRSRPIGTSSPNDVSPKWCTSSVLARRPCGSRPRARAASSRRPRAARSRSARPAGRCAR